MSKPAPPPKPWPLAAAAACLVALPAATLSGELRVTIEGIRSSRGTVVIGIYDSAETFASALVPGNVFRNDPARFAAASLRANTALEATVTFGNLEPGLYAAIVFHDENGNGRLDRNFLGVPLEPYGFSNGARARFRPPSFGEAAMALGDGDSSIRIVLTPP